MQNFRTGALNRVSGIFSDGYRITPLFVLNPTPTRILGCLYYAISGWYGSRHDFWYIPVKPFLQGSWFMVPVPDCFEVGIYF